MRACVRPRAPSDHALGQCGCRGRCCCRGRCRGRLGPKRSARLQVQETEPLRCVFFLPLPQAPAFRGVSLPSEQGLCPTCCLSARVGRTEVREGTGRTLGTWRGMWQLQRCGELCGGRRVCVAGPAGVLLLSTGGTESLSTCCPRQNEALGCSDTGLGEDVAPSLQGGEPKGALRVRVGRVSCQRRASDLGLRGSQRSLYALGHTDWGRNRHPS